MAAPGNTSGRILTAPFVVAVVILVVAGLMAGPMASRLNLKRAKLSLPLKKPLDQLDPGALAPYELKGEKELPPTVIEALGTTRYIIWDLEDSSLPADDPLRQVNLSVTYYSASEQLVLHTPDVCALGAGYKPAQNHENMTVQVPNVGVVPVQVPIRVCTFKSTTIFGGQKSTIIYTFHCNGEFVATANRIRLMINDPRSTYAYFSKVEVCFPHADREASVKGVGKLLSLALPVLLRDHWPDYKEAEERAAQAAARTTNRQNVPIG